MLVGKRVKVARGTPLLPANIRGVATYADAAGSLAFVALTDAAFVAGVGAALAMIPPPVVVDAIRTGKPPGGLVQNAYEVLNVAASLFNDVEGKTQHVKVEKLVIGPLNPELAKRLLKPAGRLDLDIGIPGYPDCKLSLLAVNGG